VIINRTEDSSEEEDLATDVLEIITVFSAVFTEVVAIKRIVEELKMLLKGFKTKLDQ